MTASADLLNKMANAIDAVHSAFGAPGDYGYGSMEGDALFALYRLRIDIHSELGDLAKPEETA